MPVLDVGLEVLRRVVMVEDARQLEPRNAVLERAGHDETEPVVRQSFFARQAQGAPPDHADFFA
eukprot:13235348-Heterocapsa_arctica.AAC.1